MHVSPVRLSSLVAVVLTIVMMAPSTQVFAQAAPGCQPGEPVRFRFGIEELHQRLGSVMGTPLQCEQVNPATGKTEQPTTTGLASYDPSINTSMFTSGTLHYALYEGRLIQWRSEDDDLPLPTATEATYLAGTEPFRKVLSALHEQLDMYQQLADTGELDSVPTQDIAALTDQLFAARQAFERVRPSARLEQYDQTVKLALDRSHQAANLLLRARMRERSPEREALVWEAGNYSENSGSLLNESFSLLRAMFPTIGEEVSEPVGRTDLSATC